MTEQIGNFEKCDDQVYSVLQTVLNTNEHVYLKQYCREAVFCKKIKTHKGRRTLAQIKVLGDLERLISGVDFVITIDYFFWRENPEKQEALLFHELCHVIADETGKLSTVPHDVEEFYSVIAKYGDWKKEIKPFVKSVKQFELFDIDARIANIEWAEKHDA
jgi:hypothetical protein